jgi:hypothetical protein
MPTTDASITGSNFIVIPVKVNTAGTWENTLAFIKGLQTGTRLFLVTGMNSSRNATDPNTLDSEIDGYIYVIVDPKVTAATKQPSTPSATPTPTPTPTVSTSPNPSGSSTPTPTTSPTPTK